MRIRERLAESLQKYLDPRLETDLHEEIARLMAAQEALTEREIIEGLDLGDEWRSLEEQRAKSLAALAQLGQRQAKARELQVAAKKEAARASYFRAIEKRGDRFSKSFEPAIKAFQASPSRVTWRQLMAAFGEMHSLEVEARSLAGVAGESHRELKPWGGFIPAQWKVPLPMRPFRQSWGRMAIIQDAEKRLGRGAMPRSLPVSIVDLGAIWDLLDAMGGLLSLQIEGIPERGRDHG